jgi:hypothetical protein
LSWEDDDYGAAMVVKEVWAMNGCGDDGSVIDTVWVFTVAWLAEQRLGFVNWVLWIC